MNKQIIKIVKKMEQLKNLFELSYEKLFGVAEICSSTYRRWKQRIENALSPVLKAGPKPVKPLDLEKLQAEMNRVGHNSKRSHGVGKLHKRMQGEISRRDLAILVADARKEALSRKKATMHQVNWNEPGTVWAMDVFEMKVYWSPQKIHVLTVQDLATGYKFTPLVTQKQPCGNEVADHLRALFSEIGKPLFLKRDNGGNLNHYAVNGLLADRLVLPLNSPAYYAPYNGAIEHAQREFKERLHNDAIKASCFNEFRLLVEITAHDLNHAARRKLSGQNSCMKFFTKNKINFCKRKRKEVFGWITKLTVDIMRKSGKTKNRPAAWRVACRTWLEKNSLITIGNYQKVLPGFL